MPLAAFAGAYQVPKVVLQLPVDGTTVPGNFVPEWLSDVKEDHSGTAVHFRVQVASDSGFGIIVAEYTSWNSVLFDYESSPGVWILLPQSGLTQANLGKKLRLRALVLASAQYWWRVRSEQFI